jgi:hypothetical protein
MYAVTILLINRVRWCPVKSLTFPRHADGQLECRGLGNATKGAGRPRSRWRWMASGLVSLQSIRLAQFLRAIDTFLHVY